jgi:dihydrofolate reductase
VAGQAAEEAREEEGQSEVQGEIRGEARGEKARAAVSGTPRITLVVAVARSGVIGQDGALPWHLPDDLRRFKALTMGKPILMGRRTWESIGRPLPGRTNLVLTRDPAFRAAGATVVASLDAALAAAAGHEELMVIGGAQVYALTAPLANRVHLTAVDADVDGDTHLPPFDPREWVETAREHHAADGRHACAMDFVTLERRARD